MEIYYKRLIIIWISIFALIIVSLNGCSSLSSSKMPEGSISMKQSYTQAMNGTDDVSSHDDHSLSSLRTQVQSLAQKKLESESQSKTRQLDEASQLNEMNEINVQFPRLPNPEIVMYVYPHLAGDGVNLVPVPGYSTVFSLYQRNYYLPNS